MKKTAIRLAAVLMAVLTLLGSVGCTEKVKAITPTEQELKTVATCGTYDLPYEEYRYVVMNYRTIYREEYGDEALKDPARVAKLQAAVLEKLNYNYAVLALCAEVGITPDEKGIQESVQSEIEEIVESLGGMKAYRASMAQNYLTDHYVRFTTAVDIMVNELYYVYTEDLGLIETDDQKILDYFENGGVARTLHIFVENDAGESAEENRRLAESLRERALNGENRDTLIGTYSEDYQMVSKTGYYFTAGEMDEAYEKAAFATAVGGVSEVVETADGFYVIFRLEPEESQILLQYTTLKQYYQYAEINRRIEEKQAEMPVVLNAYGASIDLAAME